MFCDVANIISLYDGRIQKFVFSLHRSINYLKNVSMKKLIFTLMIAVVVMFSAMAQTDYGQDVVVGTVGENKLASSNKIAVADNGWIYILSLIDDIDIVSKAEGSSEAILYVSKDDGVSYSEIMVTNVATSPFFLLDVDFIVTGSSEADIIVWIASIIENENTNENIVVIEKYDANGNFLECVAYESMDISCHSLSLATDYRSPSDFGNPFTIVAVVAGFSESGNHFLDGFYSNDGGDSFNYKMSIYQTSNEIGCVDVSLGCYAGGIGGWAGVVFEEEGISGFDVKFLANTQDFSLSTWTEPLSFENCAFPKIQCKNNINTPWGDRFVITMSDYSQDPMEMKVVYGMAGFSIYGNPAPDAYGVYNLKSDHHVWQTDLSYDKDGDHFLLTYSDVDIEDSLKITLKYQYIDYDKVHDKNQWVLHGSYSTFTSCADLYTFASPVIDINLQKHQVCFAWGSVVLGQDGSSLQGKVYADAEWSTVGVNEYSIVANSLNLAPNPTSDKTSVKVEKEGNYQGTLYDMQGRQMMAFRFSGTEYNLDVATLPAGVYIVHLQSNVAKYVNKIVVK